MNNSQSTLTKEQFDELKKAYQSVIEGDEKIWLFSNQGAPFDRDKERQKFAQGLTSKAVQKMEEELSQIYGA
jgi:hypothetical protein